MPTSLPITRPMSPTSDRAARQQLPRAACLFALSGRAAEETSERTLGLWICLMLLSAILSLPCATRADFVSSVVIDGKYRLTATSKFEGYNSVVNRPTTMGQPAYDYSVHLIKTGEEAGERYRCFTGGRWKSDQGDGDHVLQWTSPHGLPNTWSMWSQVPEFWLGKELGMPKVWFANNALEPEVMSAPNGPWLMYTQVEIDSGATLDEAGKTCAAQCDRIQLFTSDDAKTWKRFADRGVIVNIENPEHIMFDHEEMVYVPWDKDHKPFWMYVFHFIDNVPQGHIRIRSDKYDTFDFGARERVTGLSQIGNQVGYLLEAPGGPLFVRITFQGGSDRTVPVLQFSRTGTEWFGGTGGPLKLDGSHDDQDNKSTFFLGISTWYGSGRLPYAGAQRWEAIYGATTANSPVVPEIFKSEVGMGHVTLELTELTPSDAGATASDAATDDAGPPELGDASTVRRDASVAAPYASSTGVDAAPPHDASASEPRPHSGGAGCSCRVSAPQSEAGASCACGLLGLAFVLSRIGRKEQRGVRQELNRQ